MEHLLTSALQRLPVNNMANNRVEVIFQIGNKIMQYNIFRIRTNDFMIIAIDMDTNQHTRIYTNLEEILLSLYSEGEVRGVYYHTGNTKTQLYPIRPRQQRVNGNKPRRN